MAHVERPVTESTEWTNELATIAETIIEEEGLDDQQLSLEQIDHLIESIQYAAYDKGKWFITLYDNQESVEFVPTAGLINYIVAFQWLSQQGWEVKYVTGDDWIDVMVKPPVHQY